MECHFPAVGLAPRPDTDSKDASGVATVVGINPPPDVSPLESLIQGEEARGIRLWRRDLYGFANELGGKRAKRGWLPGTESIFLGKGLGKPVEELICWDGGGANQWYPRMEELPWFYGRTE